MKRPYVICHILSALDGKITGEFIEETPDEGMQTVLFRSHPQSVRWKSIRLRS